MQPTTKPGPNAGISVEQAIELFWGDLKRWPIEPDGAGNATQAQIRAIAERIAATGECLWHAQASSFGWKDCACAKCRMAVLEEVQQ